MLRVAAVAAAAVAAVACAREEAPSARAVAVRVNGVDVPARTVEAAIGRERANGPVDPKDASARGLESAIDQELLVQKALEARLDRDPDVMRAMDEGRRRILANAWLDRALADGAHPQEPEVHAFYAANPSLFAERRIYALREIRVSGPAPQLGALRAAVQAASTPAQIEASLSHAGLAREVRESTQPAETLPLALLAKLQSMKDGEATLVDSAPVVSVVELARSIPAPLSPEAAAPVIERFLATRRRAALAQEEIARLREHAKIEYPAGQGPATRERPPRDSSPAVPVNASLEATYGERADRGLATAPALSDKDQQS
jgi:EpsD family peptidyl-prolyl cis-trans isomerase